MRKLLALAFAGVFVSLFELGAQPFKEDMPKDSEFVYARVRYHLTDEGYRVKQTPWEHDYPYSDRTFPGIVQEVSGVRTSGESFHIVDIDSPELFRYPFAYLCEPGYIDLSDKDVRNLKRYLDRGGFLLVDDFRTADFSIQGGIRGPEDDIAHFQQEMRKLYPDRSFVPLGLTDPIFHSFYDIQTLDMKAPYIFPGQFPVQFLGLRDDKGHLQMVLDNNNDISEYWEWIDEGQKSIHEASTSLQFGINYVIYAMSH
jgi:Domain of unknown function (DUF4159)